MKYRLAWLILLAFTVGCLYIPSGSAQFYGNASQSSANLEQERSVPQNVLIILDASDSMNERIGGESKIQAAKDVVLKTIRNMPPNVNIGLRVYGHKLGSTGGFMFRGPFGGFMTGGDMCLQSELMVPLGTNNRATIASSLLNIQAVGKTPITYSLREAVNKDLAGVRGQKTIILVSDGRETCAGNPCDLAVDFVRSGVNVKINTVGFVTHDRFADEQLKCIALATKGRFYSANTVAELEHSLQDTTQVQTGVQAKISPGP